VKYPEDAGGAVMAAADNGVHGCRVSARKVAGWLLLVAPPPHVGLLVPNPLNTRASCCRGSGTGAAAAVAVAPTHLNATDAPYAANAGSAAVAVQLPVGNAVSEVTAAAAQVAEA